MELKVLIKLKKVKLNQMTATSVKAKY